MRSNKEEQPHKDLCPKIKGLSHLIIISRIIGTKNRSLGFCYG
jgi:hypothetical protein